MLNRRYIETVGKRAAELSNLRSEFDSLSRNPKQQGKARAVAAKHKWLASQPVSGVTVVGMLF
ncbi:MAG: hypothetical protein CMP20_15830 [Rickettsiales bacterium]|nr:hypothetical protein [Rickettsiales bacterium]